VTLTCWLRPNRDDRPFTTQGCPAARENVHGVHGRSYPPLFTRPRSLYVRGHVQPAALYYVQLSITQPVQPVRTADSAAGAARSRNAARAVASCLARAGSAARTAEHQRVQRGPLRDDGPEGERRDVEPRLTAYILPRPPACASAARAPSVASTRYARMLFSTWVCAIAAHKCSRPLAKFPTDELFHVIPEIIWNNSKVIMMCP
jgi:hypothetical protein